MGSLFPQARVRARCGERRFRGGISQWPEWSGTVFLNSATGDAKHRSFAQHVRRVDFRVAVMLLRMQIDP